MKPGDMVVVAPAALAREGITPGTKGKLWVVRGNTAKVIFPLEYPYTQACDFRLSDITPDPA